MTELQPPFKFKHNKYTKSRGIPCMLRISCGNCYHYLMSYQKDGPGPLLRCYLDRIHHPDSLTNKQYTQDISNLKCLSCSVVIGTPIIYKKENRPAYNMRNGFFIIEKIS